MDDVHIFQIHSKTGAVLVALAISEGQLVDLIVPLDTEIPPLTSVVDIKAREIVLLRHVGPLPLVMVVPRKVLEHLLKVILIWIQDHHASIDASGPLAISAPEGRGFDPRAIGVIRISLTSESSRRLTLEKIIYTLHDQQVCVEHHNLLVLREVQAMKLCEDASKAALRAANVKMLTVQVLHFAQLPAHLSKQDPPFERHVSSVQQDVWMLSSIGLQTFP
mmetsp:Transcript_99414/g.190906  ORF Transcript_99414/g.190906 Transcript_99414/m.190906 type:complete len:220 (-) Transcript_99414:166-825(-)